MNRIERSELRAPARVVTAETSRFGQIDREKLNVEGYETLWCLSSAEGVPQAISFWDVANDTKISIEDISRAIGEETYPESSAGQAKARPAGHPDITVVICTRNRPSQVKRALLSLKSQSDSEFRILVVDNAPDSPSTATVVKELGIDQCEYVIEPRPGLSRARNRAVEHVRTDSIAFIDDGETAHPDWVARLKEGFAHTSQPVAVCGLMLPAELETHAQVLFEQYGIRAEVLKADSPEVLSPLYPLPAIGSGGNMAFRTDALRSMGGFDPCLGAGTTTYGGEETRSFATILLSGGTVLHWPAAITWHFHRREMDELHRQFFGYAAGLPAFYASMIRSNPKVLIEIVRLLPHALRDLGLRDGGIRSDQLPIDFPQSLLRATHRGYLQGGFRYMYELLAEALTRT
jgi:glycosyltransferase involved in cell wall biosynthesis